MLRIPVKIQRINWYDFSYHQDLFLISGNVDPFQQYLTFTHQQCLRVEWHITYEHLVNLYRFVLSSFGVDWSKHHLNCSSVSLLLISRRDYITHARNPTAVVRRKIANEQELESALRTRNPNFRIRSVQLEKLTFHQQLALVASSDLMVGMHGAGLTHAMFLPDRSGLVELVPGKLGAGNRHFQAIARWRGIEYERWTSQRQDEDDFQTNYKIYVPPEIIDKLVRRVVSRLCSQSRL